MENGLEAELDDELGYGRYDYRNKKIPTTAATDTAAKRFEPATAMWR